MAKKLKVVLTAILLLSWVRPAFSESTDTEKLDRIYQSFVDKFRQRNQQSERLKLIDSSSRQMNEFLSGKVSKPAMKKLLPKLVPIRLLDLDDTFVTVIDNHPDKEVQALALLCFAKYCGNNGRDEICKTSLAFLKKRYGKIRYDDDTTFGQAAEEAFYFLTTLSVGKEAPRIAGTDADGTLFRLPDYRGKVVMLRFWGDWCPACRAMFDYERQLVKKHKNRPFALIGVNSDSLERLQTAQKRANLTWRTIWDGGTTNGPISTIYRVKQWPTIVVIDANGVIRFRSEGLAKPQLDEILSRCIDEAEASRLNDLAKK